MPKWSQSKKEREAKHSRVVYVLHVVNHVFSGFLLVLAQLFWLEQWNSKLEIPDCKGIQGLLMIHLALMPFGSSH